MHIEIGPYILSQRTEYSKIRITDKEGNNIDSNIEEKIIEDYNKQKNIDKYFEIDNNTLKHYIKSDLEYLFIPKKITDISPNAFCGGTFKYIHIPSSIKTIGQNAFEDCNKLEEINLPTSLKVLDNNIFIKCASLKNIVLPSKLEEVGEFAFGWCEKLKNIILPDTVKIIDNCAFYWCSSLEKINIPCNLEYFGRTPFMHSQIKTISFDKDFSGSVKPGNIYGNFVEGSLIAKMEVTNNVNYITPKLFKNVSGMWYLDYIGSKKDFLKFKKENKELMKMLPEIEINIKEDLEYLINKNKKLEDNLKTNEIER